MTTDEPAKQELPLPTLTVIGVVLVLLGLLATGIGVITTRWVLYVGWGLCIAGGSIQLAARRRMRRLG